MTLFQARWRAARWAAAAAAARCERPARRPRKASAPAGTASLVSYLQVLAYL